MKTQSISILTALTLAARCLAQDPAPAETKQDAAPNEEAAPATAPKQDSAPAEASATTPAPAQRVAKNGEIYMNFRNAPLDLVLDHMSKAAGFIINIYPGTSVSGRVDIWSNEPLKKDEAVALLNKVLGQNKLAVIREGRTLTVIGQKDAQLHDIEVKVGNKPEDVPKNDEMVTQIIPVHYANAEALIQNLTPLLPEYALNTFTANASGNSLLLTATKADVHRITEIVAALDTAISSVSSIKVFPLRYADAKALVDAVKELFTPPTQQNQTDRRAQFLQQMFGGGGGPGGFGGGGGPGGFGGGGPGGFGGRGGGGGGGGRGGGASGNTSQTASRVIAVADERSNSLVVAAPDELIPTIEDLVNKIDVQVDDITELRVFPLKNSNPQDLADMLGELFPDDTTSGSNQQFRFGGAGGGGFGGRGGFGGFGGRGGGNRGAQSTTSERAKKKGRVIAVPEPRTSMLIVSAASDLMPQIEAMIRQVDGNERGKQHTYVFTLQNADVAEVEQVLRDTFDRSGQSRANNNQNQSALQSRTQRDIQNQGQQSASQGFGGSGAGGGQGGAGFGR